MMENSMEVPKKTKIELPYDIAIPLLGISGENANSEIHTLMFIAALFTIVKIWKLPKYTSTEKWIKKMWYI